MQKMLHIGILLATVCGGILGSVSAMAQEETIVRETELTACIGPSEYAGVVEDAKEKLLAAVKRNAMSHFYGEIITATTTVENFVLTSDEVTTAMQGLVRITPNPEFYSGTDSLGEICVRAHAYVTADDLQLFALQPVRAARLCDSGIGTAQQRRGDVEKQLRTNALINFDGQLANADEERRLTLLKEVRFVDAGFQPDTGAYCAGVTGSVMPFEVYALLGVVPPKRASTPISTSTPLVSLRILGVAPEGVLSVGEVLTVRGSAPPKTQVEVLSGGVTLGVTTSEADGGWQVEIPFNDAGSYRLTTRMYLADGTVRPGSRDELIQVVAPTPTPTRTPTPTQTATRTPTTTPTPSEPSAGTIRNFGGMRFVYIPKGMFRMGSTEEELDAALALCNASRGNCERGWFAAEQPQHTVSLDAYWIGQMEVTNAQFQQFVDAGGYATERYWSAEGWQVRSNKGWEGPRCLEDDNFNAPDQPVVCVSWHEAEAYTRWLSEVSGAAIRLPTEAEWEKAARGTDGRIFPWGDEFDRSRLNFCDVNCEYDWKDETYDDGYAYTAPVGSYPEGASPYGALDMAGNVWEWVADWYGSSYYSVSPSENPQGPASGWSRVLRGGSWDNYVVGVRSAYRVNLDGPGRWYGNYGFRCVRSQ